MPDDAFDELDRLFGLMSEQFGTKRTSVPIDVVDDGDAFVIRADLPGYAADDVDVTLRDARRVRIRAAREGREHEGRYLRHERRQRTADRTVGLPDPVDPDETTATYDAGVLTVRLAKRTGDGDGTDVPVQTGDSGE